jgi:hypothetical protein
MAVECPNCHESVANENVNVQAAVAQCDACGDVFSIGQPSAAPEPARPEVSQPKRFEVTDTGNAWNLTFRWLNWQLAFIGPFAIFWDGFLIFWYATALGGGKPSGFDIIAVLFPLIHVAVGVGITYYVIALLVNRTVVHLTVDQLQVRHGPLPWWGNKSFDPAHIKQLYCKREFWSSGNDNNMPRYSVNALFLDDTSDKLLSGLADPEKARFIERALEKALKIEDEPVSGEVLP